MLALWGLISLSAFLPVVSILFYKITANVLIPNALPGLKDLIVIFLFIVSGVNLVVGGKIKFSLVPLVFLFAAFSVWHLVEMHGSIAPFSAVLVNVRRNFILPIVFFAVIFMPISSWDIVRLTRWTKLVGLIVCGFGLLEYHLPDYFWNNVFDIPSYWGASTLDFWPTDSILESGRFYSWDLAFITGNKTRRLVSTFAEPTTLAAFLSFLFVYFQFKKKQITSIDLSTLIFFVCGLLTLSKSFLLCVIVALFMFSLGVYSILPIVLGTIFVYLLSYVFFVYGLVLGPFSHVSGFYSSVNMLFSGNLKGFGLGMAGNYAAREFKDLTEFVGDESGFGNMAAQVGVGAILYVGIVWYLLHMLAKRYKTSGDTRYRALFLALAGWYFVFLISASSLGFTGNFLFFLFTGLYLNGSVCRTLPKVSISSPVWSSAVK